MARVSIVPPTKHPISQSVDSFAQPTSSIHLREAWRKEIGSELSDELWDEGMWKIKDCSMHARLQLIYSV